MSGDDSRNRYFLRRAFVILAMAACLAPALVQGQASGRRPGAPPQRRAAQRPARPGAANEPKPSDFKPGQKVEALWINEWLPATVVSIDGPFVRVRYDKDGFEAGCFPKDVRPLSPAAAAKAPAANAPAAGGAPKPAGRASAPTTPPADANEPAPDAADATPVSEADSSGARHVVPDVDAPWTYKPAGAAPAAKAPAGGANGVLLGSVALPSPWGIASRRGPGADAFWEKFNRIVVASPDSAIAFAVHVIAAPGKPKLSRAQRVDLAGKKVVGQPIDLPPDVDVIDASPDGTRLLLRSDKFHHGTRSRLDVYALAGGAAPKHVVSFEPYKGATGMFANDVSLGRFVDNDHVLTSNRDGADLWKLEGARVKAVYALQGATPTLDSSRKVAAVAGSGGVSLLDAMTGATLGHCAAEGAVESPSFSPDGRWLAASTPGGRRLIVWDLATGKQARNFPLQHGVSPTPIQWLEDNFVLLGGDNLLDLTKGVVAWEYDLAPGGATYNLGGGRVAGASAQRAAAGLRVYRLPHAAARKHAQNLDPKNVLAVRSGTRVSLEITTDAPEEQRQTIEQRVAKQLRDNGITVADGQPVRLALSTTPGESRQVSFSDRSPFGPVAATISVTELVHRAVLTVDGVVAWESQGRFTGQGMFSRKQGESVEQMVERARGESYRFFENVTIPKEVPKPKSLIPPGKSKPAQNGLADEAPAPPPAAPARAPF